MKLTQNGWFVGSCVSKMELVNGPEFCSGILLHVTSLYIMLNYCQT